MFAVTRDGEKNLDLLAQGVEAVLEAEVSGKNPDIIAALANISAVLAAYLPDINWAGFYILKDRELTLGPFQGLPACSRIGEGRGVCGRAVQDRKTVVVDDVSAFPGHITCDSASVSEIVVPLFKGEQVWGVMDIDSPLPGRFTALEEDCLNRIGKCIGAFLEG